MFTFNFNGQNFEKVRIQMQLMEYQSVANQIIQTFDFNDIKKAIAFAKESIPKKEGLSVEEKLAIIDSLFEKTIGWLQKNGRKIK